MEEKKTREKEEEEMYGWKKKLKKDWKNNIKNKKSKIEKSYHNIFTINLK